MSDHAPGRPHSHTHHQGGHFDSIAHEYDEAIPAHVMEHYHRKRVAMIRRWAPPRAKVLDMGCGTGALLKRCEPYFTVFGVDPSGGMLRVLATPRPDSRLAAADGSRLPFRQGVFDLVYCVAVLHHVIDPAAVKATLGEMVRVTSPGGHVIVWDHNPRNPYWPYLMKRVPQDHGDERLVPEREIFDGLEAGGAEVVSSEQLGLMPDFAPRPLVGAFAGLESLVERVPGARRLCAHNVVVARRRTSR
ncbi:MAG: methyltransferase domain-containing protein [Actinomycetota bacterium]|nr:methyltransferase domain-containing protein [Actinomycetota bacterium]